MAISELAGEPVHASRAELPAATTNRSPADVEAAMASLIALDFLPPNDILLTEPR
jgi:hypothetical protein